MDVAMGYKTFIWFLWNSKNYFLNFLYITWVVIRHIVYHPN